MGLLFQFQGYLLDYTTDTPEHAFSEFFAQKTQLAEFPFLFPKQLRTKHYTHIQLLH